MDHTNVAGTIANVGIVEAKGAGVPLTKCNP